MESVSFDESMRACCCSSLLPDACERACSGADALSFEQAYSANAVSPQMNVLVASFIVPSLFMDEFCNASWHEALTPYFVVLV